MKKIITMVVIISYVSLVVIAQKFGEPKKHGKPERDFGTVPDEEVPEIDAEKIISGQLVLRQVPACEG